MKRHFMLTCALCLTLTISVAASCATPSAPTASTASVTTAAPEPSGYHSGVKTDTSALSAYKPLPQVYTRLSDGPLPELKTADTYGTLLPYQGESIYFDGGFGTGHHYGFITIKSIIVTDPVYSNIYQASCYDENTGTYLYMPAYVLTLKPTPDDIQNQSDEQRSDMMMGANVRHAVCALDGSWMTPSIYAGAFCNPQVILCVRDWDTADIDIYDYSGKLLYNTASLSFFKNLPVGAAYSFQSGYGEGLFVLPLSTGQTAYVSVMDGTFTITSYIQGGAFHEGLAPVKLEEDGPSGYIDRNYKLVLKPQYLYTDKFYGGNAIVRLLDTQYAIIDKKGTVLLTSPEYIQTTNTGYLVLDAFKIPHYYDKSLVELRGTGEKLTLLEDGWLYYVTGTGVVLQRGSEKHILRGINAIQGVTEGLICYSTTKNDAELQGVKTLDGVDVIPPTQDTFFAIVKDVTSGQVFIMGQVYSNLYGSLTYRICSSTGKTLFSGNGTANYLEQFGLFVISDEESFGYTDLNGKYIFRISLQQYVPD